MVLPDFSREAKLRTDTLQLHQFFHVAKWVNEVALDGGGQDGFVFRWLGEAGDVGPKRQPHITNYHPHGIHTNGGFFVRVIACNSKSYGRIQLSIS